MQEQVRLEPGGAFRGELKDKPQVKRELDILVEDVDRLNHMLDRLEDRLSPVLRMAEEEKANRPAEMETVPLAGAIREVRDSVRCHVSRVQSILERLEV